jgi:hypothetical protein
MGRTIFQRVTSGSWELRIRYKTGSECSGYNFNGVFVNDPAACTINGTGDPLYEEASQGYILLSSGFDGLSQETKITGLVHEMGHDLGLEDHYTSQGVPNCRSDVVSIMENWGCSGGSPTSHDIDDMNQAYKVAGVPWVNYIWVNSSTSASWNYDTVNAWDHSVHNEMATNGMRWRKKSSLEGTVLQTGNQSRSQSTNSYSYSFTLENSLRCFSANGRNNYVSGEGNDGSEACVNRSAAGAGYVVGTSDTRNDNNLDYFRLWNFTGSTITNAAVYSGSTFIAWITQDGQPSGQIANNQYGKAYNLNLAKGTYTIVWNVGGGGYSFTLGLDD